MPDIGWILDNPADHLPPVNVTENMRLRDTLIIGCGGFGILTAAYLRARLGAFMDPGTLKRIRFLGIDTMASLESSMNTILRYFDTSDLINISAPVNIFEIIENPENFSDILESMPDLGQLNKAPLFEILDPLPGAGTQRLFSRLCLRSLPENINRITNEINARFSGSGFTPTNPAPPVIEEEPGNWTYIFLISSLYGGTGAGIFLDIAALCRSLGKQNNDRTTFITGLLYTPSFLGTRQSNHHKSQCYAALKELDHFMSGNPLEWSYSNGTHVNISNKYARDRLFNMVFLMDTPSQAEKLSGSPAMMRNQLAECGSDLIFNLCATGIGEDFFTRLVDKQSSETRFINQYPPITQDEKQQRIRKEQRITAYSAAHFKTVGVDQVAGREFLLARYSLELFENSFGTGVSGSYQTTDRLIDGFAGEAPLMAQLGLSYDTLLHQYRGVTVPTIECSPDSPALIRNLPDQIKKAVDSAAEKTRQLKIKCPEAIQHCIKEIVNTHGIDTARQITGRLKTLLEGENCTEKINKELSLLRQDIDPERTAERLNTLAGQAAQLIQTAREENRQSWVARGVRGTLNIIGGSAASGRNQFHQSLPGYLAGVIGQVQRITRQARNLIIHQQMLDLILHVMETVNHIDKQEVASVFARVSAIKNHLENRVRNLNPKALITPSLSFIHVAEVYAAFETRYYDYFLTQIPMDSHPQEKGKAIRQNGLELLPGQIIRLDNLGRFPVSEIIRAIDNVTLRDIGNTARNLTIDFNNSDIFPYQRPPLENSFEYIFKRLQEAQDPLLPVSFSGQHNIMEAVIAASLVKSGIPRWNGFFQTAGIFPGCSHGLVTYSTLKLGFPLVALKNLREWYLEYLKEIFKKLPVHAIKSAVYMRDVYFDQSFRPDTNENDLLFFVAADSDIWAIHHDISRGYILGNPKDAARTRSDLQQIFYNSFHKKPIYLSEIEFKGMMDVDFILTHEIFLRVINKIIKKTEDDKKYSDFQWPHVKKRLIDTLIEDKKVEQSRVGAFFKKIDDMIVVR